MFRTLTSLTASLPGLNLDETSPSRVCEGLTIAQLSPEQLQKSRRAHWRRLTSSAIPADIRDFSWLRGWRVLPTGDRIAAWGVAPSARCPQCGLFETLRHAMFHCVVASTFWILMSRMFATRLNARSSSREVFVNTLLCVGIYVLWRQRGAASLSHRPQRAMFPMLQRVRTRLFEQACLDAVRLSEAEFLKRWSTHFIVLRDGRVSAHLLPY